jgi:hypothetical protein
MCRLQKLRLLISRVVSVFVPQAQSPALVFSLVISKR